MPKQRINRCKLFVCASCEWIFREVGFFKGCPKCGFAYYGAHRVYGNNAYRYAKTQQPWLDRKVTDYRLSLYREIKKSQEEEKGAIKRNPTMPYLPETTHSFRCDCGSNVFLKIEPSKYQCNGCKAIYRGEM